MAWIQMDTDLESKPEYTRLRRLTRVSKAELTRRIFHLWCWIDQSTTDGFYPGFDAHDLEDQFEGTTADFWQCFAHDDVQWLKFTDEGLAIPGYEKRFSQSAKRRAKQAKWVAGKRKGQDDEGESTECRHDVDTDVDLDQRRSDQSKNQNISGQSSDGTDQKDLPIRKTRSRAVADVDATKVEQTAGLLFSQASYEGDDGRVFWEVAAVLEAIGGFSEHQAIDAARGCRTAGNKPAYFRRSMQNLCPDFESRLRKVWIHPRLPTKPPDLLTREQRLSFQIRRAPPVEGNPDAVNQLERMAAQEA